MAAIEPVEQRQPVHARHAHVRDQHVRLLVFDCLEQVFAALEAARRHTFLLERLLQHPTQRLIVVDDPGFQLRRLHAVPRRVTGCE